MVFIHDLPEVAIFCLIVMLLYRLETIASSDSPTISAGNRKRRMFTCAGIAAKLCIVQERRRKARIAIIRLVKYALTFAAHKAGVDAIQGHSTTVIVMLTITP